MGDGAAIIGTVLGAVYVLVVPGLALSFVFFRRGSIDIIERTALSCALSIAVVPLASFYLNLVGVKITRINVILEVAAIITVAIIVAWRRGAFNVADQTPKESPDEPPPAPSAPELPKSPTPRRKRPIVRL